MCYNIYMDDKQESYEQLLSKITHTNKRLFLENYSKFKYLTHTAKGIGVSWQVVYNWLESDKVFSEAFELLKKQVKEDIIRIHEENIEEICLDPKTPAQSRIFGSLVRLRAEAPEKYREKYTPDLKLTGDITIKLGVPAYADAPLQIETKKQLKEGK